MKFAHIKNRAVAVSATTLDCGAPAYGPVGVGRKQLKRLIKQQVNYSTVYPDQGRGIKRKGRALHRWEMIEAGKITGLAREALEREFAVEFACFRKKAAQANV